LEVVEIRDYVERDSKANAVQIVGEFLDAANRLKTTRSPDASSNNGRIRIAVS
jgi:hypothetical protein